jgi:D-glycero-D-manno-heptose 1,7-bisphosphate phosphatase
MNKAVFLDKDGTLVVNVPYNINPEHIELERFVVDGLRKLQRAGYLLIIASNQSGVALGHFSEFALQRANERLYELLMDCGVKINATYYCPHYPSGYVKAFAKECDCRKPMPGLLKKAAHDFNIDLKKSWMIGDILHDVEAGKRAGCKSILVDNGNETEWKTGEWRQPDFKVTTLNEAAEIILSHTDHPTHALLENMPKHIVHSCR